jgi:hypothetical protein
MTTYETAEAMLDLYQLRELSSPSEFGWSKRKSAGWRQ